VAKPNPLQLKRAAEDAEKAGKFEKAIDLLKQIVLENPKDWNTVNRIGDLYLKVNNEKAANEQYERSPATTPTTASTSRRSRSGRSPEERSVEARRNMALGDLYARQGLVAEAKQTLNVVVDEYIKRNKKREAGEVLRRLAEWIRRT